MRVKDICFETRQILVRNGKGMKDRVTVLPDNVIVPLQTHLNSVRAMHNGDLQDGFGEIYLPYALAQKAPHAASSGSWHYVFPSSRRSRDPRSGKVRRHHVHESTFAQRFKAALARTEIVKLAVPHTLRHSFATHMLFVEVPKSTQKQEHWIQGMTKLLTSIRFRRAAATAT